jgi:hypothetical protein
MYELHIYTMGDRAYAREIAALLDPGGRLFAGRVVSAGDRSDPHPHLCRSSKRKTSASRRPARSCVAGRPRACKHLRLSARRGAHASVCPPCPAFQLTANARNVPAVLLAVKNDHRRPPAPAPAPPPRSTKAHEKGLDVLLASEAHVLVLDDTEHVWAAHKRNLIQARELARGPVPPLRWDLHRACPAEGAERAGLGLGVAPHALLHALALALRRADTVISLPPGRAVPLFWQQHPQLAARGARAVGGPDRRGRRQRDAGDMPEGAEGCA